MIVPAKSVEKPGWLQLRQALWPDGPAGDHLAEMAALLAEPARYAKFLAFRKELRTP